MRDIDDQAKVLQDVRSSYRFNSFWSDNHGAVHDLTFIFKFAETIRIFLDITISKFQRNAPNRLNVQFLCNVFRYLCPRSTGISKELNFMLFFRVRVVDHDKVNIYVSHLNFSSLALLSGEL